jgi:transcriptional regulator with XRE-family HTH domain
VADLPISTAVRNVRLRRGLSQRQVAARAGLKRTYISKVENSRCQPLLEQFVRLADGMNIEPWRLLRYTCRLRDELEEVK